MGVKVTRGSIARLVLIPNQIPLKGWRSRVDFSVSYASLCPRQSASGTKKVTETYARYFALPFFFFSSSHFFFSVRSWVKRTRMHARTSLAK